MQPSNSSATTMAEPTSTSRASDSVPRMSTDFEQHSVTTRMRSSGPPRRFFLAPCWHLASCFLLAPCLTPRVLLAARCEQEARCFFLAPCSHLALDIARVVFGGDMREWCWGATCERGVGGRRQWRCVHVCPPPPRCRSPLRDATYSGGTVSACACAVLV